MKTDSQKESVEKSKKRMERYERKQMKSEENDNSKSVTFYEKLGNDAEWEKKEYIFRTKE